MAIITVEVTAPLIETLLKTGFTIRGDVTIKEGIPIDSALLDVKMENGIVAFRFLSDSVAINTTQKIVVESEICHVSTPRK